MIHRADHNDNFTMIQNGIIEDERLTFEEKGFLLWLLSFSDKWEFSINGLSFIGDISRNTTMRLVSKLKECGYIRQTKKQNKKGQFTSYEWDIYELPEVDKNRTSVLTELGENRTTATPKYGESRPITSTNNKQVPNITSTKDKKKSTKKKFVPPTLEEIQAYCESRNSDVDPKKFFEYYQEGNWKDAKGNPVKNWKQKLITWEGRQKKPKTGPIQEEEDVWDKIIREEREGGII